MTDASAPFDLILLAAVCLALMAGFPVAFTLGGTAVLVAATASVFGADIAWGAVPLRIYGIVTNPTLLAIPFFVLMGLVLEKSRLAEDLLLAMAGAFRKTRGGLLLSVTLVGALLAASTGIVGATVVTMTLIALPSLLRSGYPPALSAGSIAAAGTLGQIIPPSIVLIVLSDQISTAYQTAQRAQGAFAPDPFSVADLFAAALLPGLCLVGMYLVYQFIRCRSGAAEMLVPEPVLPAFPQADPAPPISQRTGAAFIVLAPLVLILCVLGAILGGMATTTEAAALGAAGAIVLAGYRVSGNRPVLLLLPACAVAGLIVGKLAQDMTSLQPGPNLVATAFTVLCALGLLGGLVLNIRFLHRANLLGPVLDNGIQMIAMIFAIVVGATVFALMFRELGGDQTIDTVLSGLPGGTLGAILAVMLVMFILGFFLDFLEIVFVVVPLVAPILLQMTLPDGSMVSPAWLAVMMAVNLQTSFLTPPFGFALFYFRGAAGDLVSTVQLYKGVAPFVGLQLCLLVLLWLMPGLATWLPSVL
ncbi:C4-dicarboxylate ABC transporter [Roseibium aquae]|uniref:C4-dicarboxylate ABC transporter n=1 Tax=Roseibium aquae TaxID=1323746 RepID=A0A916T4Z2_9HYPH|nr:TRAP transporter large permease subunit [Roseibium aquae]GGB32075.1 C4-dicarboxylate ABC transporter [Roseibium aquae]